MIDDAVVHQTVLGWVVVAGKKQTCAALRALCSPATFLFHIYKNPKKEKEKLPHTERSGRMQRQGRRRTWTHSLRESRTYLHVYTQGSAQQVLHTMSHMYEGHTKTARHRAFPDGTLPQRTEPGGNQGLERRAVGTAAEPVPELR